MGEEYREAAVKCIEGDFGQSGASILKAFYVEVVEVLGRCLVNYQEQRMTRRLYRLFVSTSPGI